MMRILIVTFTVFLFCAFARGQDLTGGADLQGGLAVFRMDVAQKRVVLARQNLSKAQQAAEINTLLAEGSGHLSLLREVSKTREVSAEYVQSVVDDIEILRSIKTLGRIGQPQWEQLQALNADLRVKSNQVAILGESGFDSIEVVVRTMKNGQELSNYQVWYVKEAYKNNPTKYQTFDRFSSPVVRRIPPGRYVMWTQATNGSKAEGEKTPKEFGDGQARVETDLTAP